jgi:hypothetical protein
MQLGDQPTGRIHRENLRKLYRWQRRYLISAFFDPERMGSEAAHHTFRPFIARGQGKI